jgi:hypothetical protein
MPMGGREPGDFGGARLRQRSEEENPSETRCSEAIGNARSGEKG